MTTTCDNATAYNGDDFPLSRMKQQTGRRRRGIAAVSCQQRQHEGSFRILIMTFWVTIMLSDCFAFQVSRKYSTKSRISGRTSLAKEAFKGKLLPLAASVSSCCRRLSALGSSSSSENNNTVENANLIMVMDWECLLENAVREYYIPLGIQAAFAVWPSLKEICDTSDLQWVENKLAAISGVLPCPPASEMDASLQPSPYHLACEYALATRLILEEQALDMNASTGKKGKYAKKFHPRQDLPSVVDNDDNKNDAKLITPSTSQQSTTGTRPLTVGELSANWRDSLRETLLIKYHVDYKPPLQVLEDKVKELLKENQQSTTTTLPLYKQTKFALTNTSRRIIVRVRHASDVDTVEKSLGVAGIACHILAEYDDTALLEVPSVDVDENDGGRYLLPSLNLCVPNSAEKALSDHDFLLRILHHCGKLSENVDNATRVVYMDSSWHRLQPLVDLFGDYIPRNGSNTAKCVVPNTILSLYLAEWAVSKDIMVDTTTTTAPNTSNTRNSQLEQAMVYPWTDVLSWDAAEDLLLPKTAASTTAFQ